MTNSELGIFRKPDKSFDCELSITFRRDKYLAPPNIYELMRIDKMIRELPLHKKQGE